MVRLDVKALGCGLYRLVSRVHNSEKLCETLVENALVDFACLKVGKQPHSTVSTGCGHKQVRARSDSVGVIVVCAPVGNDKAVKAPLAAQNIFKKMLVFVSVSAVDHIVG